MAGPHERKGKRKKEKLPLDAKLLSQAIIELNISRRSVGLYPPDHPITKRSIESVYDFLKKLFEVRSSITLGVAKDVLMVDEYTLDRKNPVYIEFALALHKRGIASVTFYSGLEEKEVLDLHILISDKDLPTGQALVETARSKNLRHIRLAPVDISKLRFVEGTTKKAETSTQSLWEDYVYGLLEGTLAGDEVEGVVYSMPPEDVARIISNYPSGTKEESYDRVITAYIGKKGHQELHTESLKRFTTLIENLNPKIKEQFLSRTFEHSSINPQEAENLLKKLTPEDVEKVMHIFLERPVLPESMRNLINKLAETKKTEPVKEDLRSPRVDDIELNEEMMKLFDEDRYGEFVGEQYKRDIEKMLKAQKHKHLSFAKKIHKSMMRPEVLDRTFSDIVLKLVDFESIKRDDHLKLLTLLSELTETFLETGRFEEVLYLHNAIYTHMLTGSFRTDTLSMLEYFFHSEQFILKFLKVLKIWGRSQREVSLKLARALRLDLINPLLDALTEEESPSQRKFYLSILNQMGRDVLPEAARRLNDQRWYVVRNMIYLIREGKGSEHVSKIRPLTKDKNKKICVEALKTLLHFNTPDAFPQLMSFLTGKNPQLKEQAIKLSGNYRIKKAVPYLIDILDKRDFLGIELQHKLSAVKALGKIGDPEALDTLKRLYSSRYLLYESVTEEIRSEIIKSLNNYPFEQARPILELALDSKNEETRSLAEKLVLRKVDA